MKRSREMEKVWGNQWPEYLYSWHQILEQSRKGSLLEFLTNNIHRNQWTISNQLATVFNPGATLLHYACGGSNESAILELLHVIDVNHRGINPKKTYYPIQTAIHNNQPRNVTLMLAAGFDKPIDHPLGLLHECAGVDKCAEILVSNGYRLKEGQFMRFNVSNLIEIEQSVVQCRDVIVVLLGLKKHRQVLGKLDRFLIQQELAVAIWSDRWN